MRRKRFIGTMIMLAIALVWLVAAALIVMGLLRSEQRTRELAAIALDRILGNQRYQFETTVHRMEEELLGEADHLAATDSLEEEALLDRWVFLKENDPAIVSVTLADEAGNAWIIKTTDSTWTYTLAANGSRSSPPLITTWPAKNSGRVHRVTAIGDTTIDPRNTIWFGQSLGSRQTSPTWSTDSTSGSTLLHVSTLIRSPDPKKPYRILSFALSPERAIERSGLRPTTHAAIYMTAEGADLMPLDTTTYGRAVRTAERGWSKGRDKNVTLQLIEGAEWASQIVPLRLNGTTLYSGAIISTVRFREWTGSETRALWWAAVILFLLGVLLVAVWARTRRADRRVRRQEKKSRTRERQLAKAIGEREVLDREVHHRVKNNLQVVSSLLNLQAQRIVDPRSKEEFMRSKRRIDSMALVHQKLYGQKDLRAIDLKMFLTQVANSVQAMFEPRSRAVSHNVDTAGITADADTAIQLGVIMCELLANCHLHAFPYATGGHIEIQVRPGAADLFMLVVSDNGRGMQREAGHGDIALGLEIVEALADQIDGRVDVEGSNGTKVTVHFKMQGLRGVPGGA